MRRHLANLLITATALHSTLLVHAKTPAIPTPTPPETFADPSEILTPIQGSPPTVTVNPGTTITPLPTDTNDTLLPMNTTSNTTSGIPPIRLGDPCNPFVTSPFENVMTILMDSFDQSDVLSEFYFGNVLTRKGYLLTGLSVPGNTMQANSLSLLAGSTMNVTSEAALSLNANTIIDSLESRNLTWKAYFEGYNPTPTSCTSPMETQTESPDAFTTLTYMRSRNPFMSFTTIRNNPSRCSKIQNLKSLNDDLSNGGGSGTLSSQVVSTPSNVNMGAFTTTPASSFAPQSTKASAGVGKFTYLLKVGIVCNVL
ncbi:hypothetical protein HDU76_003308 [Blyttiomyces sp. JEL0837]|nr:hypothetical protein HDU76_003308 [Blyttiomyces sp. JEL0837]